ncbi:sodium:proton exchanger [Alteromonas sp. 5E99-2]|uniref:Na+/H+ antiporter NhaC family protein n=1 Tax=Alteromonas sp. 5E99-2 TaxID=2817683 RepID=UPI001A9919D1|nr:Na+/H+ antiporter NhaC family protein [Alteromonas sp. 5E99-2]MBO1256311.1 sodium:proton exchanger [Alteromonas sp. 5E99-2]
MTSPDITSILPIVLTLVFSLYTRNVVIGLFTGVVTATVMLTGFNPFSVLSELVKSHLVGTVTDSYNAGVIVLMVFIGGFVALMEKSGGGPAFALQIMQWINSRARAQIASWCGGILIFYSDLGTPLIVGPVFRPLFDKLKVSRQKLAFIIDSTASPVAILVPFIGWGIYIMGLMQKEFDSYQDNLSAWDGFIRVIPFQFYAILAIVIVPLLIWRKADFGAMALAEKACVTSSSTSESNEVPAIQPFTHKNARASFVFIPLVIMACVLAIMLVPLGFPFNSIPGSDFRAGLSSAYFLAAVALIGLMTWYKVRDLQTSISLYLSGMNSMMSVIVVLVLAWTLSSLGKELGTAQYIAEQAQRGFPYWLLPAVAFVLSGVISFATGSSWGTFAIMLPLVIPTAISIEAALFVSIGAVLSGGLFGDHCSPISETTILSATGANCNQFDHFQTQLPYALLNGSVALVSFLIAGFYQHWALFLMSLFAQLILVLMLTKGAKRQTLLKTDKR